MIPQESRKQDISPVDCWGRGAHDNGTAQKPTLAMVPMRVLTRDNPQWIRLESVLERKNAGSLQVVGHLLVLFHRSYKKLSWISCLNFTDRPG